MTESTYSRRLRARLHAVAAEIETFLRCPDFDDLPGLQIDRLNNILRASAQLRSPPGDTDLPLLRWAGDASTVDGGPR